MSLGGKETVFTLHNRLGDHLRQRFGVLPPQTSGTSKRQPERQLKKAFSTAPVGFLTFLTFLQGGLTFLTMQWSPDYYCLRLSHGSMEPTLKPGDIVLVHYRPDVEPEHVQGRICACLVDGQPRVGVRIVGKPVSSGATGPPQADLPVLPMNGATREHWRTSRQWHPVREVFTHELDAHPHPAPTLRHSHRGLHPHPRAHRRGWVRDWPVCHCLKQCHSLVP